MFGNFSMPELLIVGALALIVIGPKDLPRMMRSVGKFVGQARGMARQFQRSMDDAAREVDLQEFKDARSLMDKKADTSGLTDTLNKTIGFDDEKPKKPALDREEMAEAAKQFTGDPAVKSDPPKAAPKPEPEVAQADPAPVTAEAEPAKVTQG